MKKMKKNLIKIFDRIKYILEFIFSLFFIISIYKIITIKNYEGYWSRKILVYLLLFGIITIIIIVYNCIKDRNKIEKMFLNFAIPVGLSYIIFMLPTYTPDAGAHLWKAYEVSEGTLFTEIDENGKSYTAVPEVLSTYRETTLTKYNILNELFSKSEAFDYNKTTNVDTPAKIYNFIYYIGYAIGLAISRILSLNLFIGVLFARIINFIIFLSIAYISIKIIPFGKILLATYLMIPMMFQQATAISADSIMNIMIILFISYTLYLAFKKERLKNKEQVIILILSIFVGISKLTYIPVLGIGLILIKHRKEWSLRRKILIGLLAIIVCFGSAFISNRISSRYSNTIAIENYLKENGVNNSEQIKGIINNPVHFIKVLFWNNLNVNGEYYLYGCIGQHMGWLTILFPTIYIFLYILLLFAAVFVENNEEVLNLPEKIWMTSLGIIMALLVVTGLYIEHSRVGSDIVAGVQGRYFLPIIVLPLLCICKKNNFIKIKQPNILIPLWAFVINLLFIGKIITFFI